MKVLLLMNPASRGGRGKKLWPQIFAALTRYGIDFDCVELKNIKEAFTFAAAAGGYDAVAAVGGDGTVNAAAAGVLANAQEDLCFAVLYTGTSPDFCRFYQIPVDIEAAVELLASSKSCRIPLLCAGERPFFCSCNPGMGAEVAAAANRLRPFFGDRTGTFLALLKALLRNKKRDFRVNGKVLKNCNHLLFSRMEYIAGGLKICMPELDDDQYVMWYLQNVSRAGWLKVLWKLYRGKPCGKYTVLKGITSVETVTDEVCPLEFDGDPQGQLPLEINFYPRKLNLICKYRMTAE